MDNEIRKALALTLVVLLWILVLPIGSAIDWSVDLMLTWDLENDSGPSIMRASNGIVWVFWHSRRTGNEELFYKTYNASLVHPWSQETRLTNNSSVDIMPYVFQASDGKIWIVWMTNRTGNYDIFYKIYDGTSWSDDKRLTDDASRDEFPSIVEAYGKIWVFWDSRRGTGNYDLFYKTTVDNGMTWSSDTLAPVSSSTYDDWDPAVMRAFDGRIWLVWTRSSHIHYSVYAGQSWSSAQPITSGGNDNWHPSLMQTSDTKIWVFWDSGKYDPYVPWDIFYSVYTGSWSSPAQVTTYEGEDVMPSPLQDAGGVIWVAWASDRGNYNIYYRTSSLSPDHDLEIFSVCSSKTWAYEGESVDITVVARNHGKNSETAVVRCFANNSLIGTQTTIIAPGQLSPNSFAWSTEGFAVGSYLIKANVTLVVGETNTADNEYIYDMVKLVRRPVAFFIYSPAYPLPNGLITFNATLSIPSEGTITSYLWEFGDGNITNVTYPIITHAYPIAQTYTVKLNITDSEGRKDTEWKYVPVHVHDLAVIGGFSYADKSAWGELVFATADVINKGTAIEFPYISVYFGEVVVGTTSVVIGPSETLYNIEIICDTGLVLPGSHLVRIVVFGVPGETYLDDNSMNLGYIWVYVLDLTVINAVIYDTDIYTGNMVDVMVTVRNSGTANAHAALFLYYNESFIEQKNIFLVADEQEDFMFTWNTASAVPGSYRLKAIVEAREEGLSELNISDNTFTSNMIKVKLPGDINGDSIVTSVDLSLLNEAFGSILGSHNWNSSCDINDDNRVDMFDLMLLGTNFGKSEG